MASIYEKGASRFSNVDATEDAASFIAFLDRATASRKEHKKAAYALLNIKPGDHVLDIGCGAGDDACALGTLVGPEGLVIGVDNSEVMVTEARKRAADVNLQVKFMVSDVHDLDFPDACFDVCRAERIFTHLADPVRALSEMARVTKPGGRVAIIDFDHDMLAIDAEDKATTRAIVTRRGDEFRNGWISRQLPRLFVEVGLQKPEVILWPIIHTDLPAATALLGLEIHAQKLKEEGILEEETIQAWLQDLQERHNQGRFFACMVEFTIITSK